MTIQKNIKLFASSLVLLSSSVLAGEFSCESIYGNSSCSDGNENHKYIFTANAEKNNVAMLQYDLARLCTRHPWRLGAASNCSTGRRCNRHTAIARKAE